jgi:hypothetical protein
MATPAERCGGQRHLTVRPQQQPTFATKSAIFCLERLQQLCSRAATNGATEPETLDIFPSAASGQHFEIVFGLATRKAHLHKRPLNPWVWDDEHCRIARKQKLGALLRRHDNPCVRYSEPFKDGEQLLAECGPRGLEGIVSKRKQAQYRSGKCDWVKVKCAQIRPRLNASSMRAQPFQTLSMMARYASESARMRERLPCQLSVSYSGSGRKSAPLSSITSKAHTHRVWSAYLREWSRRKLGVPSSSSPTPMSAVMRRILAK